MSTNLLVLLETVFSMSFSGEVCRVSTGKAVEGPCREERLRRPRGSSVRMAVT